MKKGQCSYHRQEYRERVFTFSTGTGGLCRECLETRYSDSLINGKLLVFKVANPPYRLNAGLFPVNSKRGGLRENVAYLCDLPCDLSKPHYGLEVLKASDFPPGTQAQTIFRKARIAASQIKIDPEEWEKSKILWSLGES